MAILAHALLWPQLHRLMAGRPARDQGGRVARLRVVGMTCGHCAQTVERALRRCAGVESVDVDIRCGTAVVSGDNFTVGPLIEAVESSGYEAREDEGDAPRADRDQATSESQTGDSMER
jgi:copper chaperone CopZ